MVGSYTHPPALALPVKRSWQGAQLIIPSRHPTPGREIAPPFWFLVLLFVSRFSCESMHPFKGRQPTMSTLTANAPSPSHGPSRSRSRSRSASPTRNSHLLTAYSEFQPLSAHDLAVLDHYQADAADLLAVRSHLIALDAQVRTLRSQVLVLVDADLAKYHAAATRIQAAWRGTKGRQSVRKSRINVPVRVPAEVVAGKKHAQALSSSPVAATDPEARASAAALAARLAPIESGFADLASTVDQLASQLSAFIASSSSSSSPHTDQQAQRSPTAASFRSVTPRPSPPHDLDRLHRQVMVQELQVEKLREALAKVMADNARMRGVVKSAAARTIQAKWKSTRPKPTQTQPGPSTPPPATATSSDLSTASSSRAARFGAAPVSPSPICPRIRQPIFDPQTPTTLGGAAATEESFLDQVARKTSRRGSTATKRHSVMMSPRNVMSGIDSGSDGGHEEDGDGEGKWVSVDDFNYMRAEVELLRAELDRVVAMVGRAPAPVTASGSAGEDTSRLDAMESGNTSMLGASVANYVAQPLPHAVSVAAVLRSSMSVAGSDDMNTPTRRRRLGSASAPPQVSSVPMGATLVGPVAFYDF
ncbi:hypothetical protein BCR44DRAFT_1432162 [Catenaria anguillulae PL171]|uniref:Uncharacterized protein n=1 Tax=Catenaria anguillulae PL171 TaxID=765915 RepID=A0A1Y2HRK0_9FUNG|nr:hypothetical protein BCR44DRAFT_1432162 [Catenaria anguillulae PL171]